MYGYIVCKRKMNEYCHVLTYRQHVTTISQNQFIFDDPVSEYTQKQNALVMIPVNTSSCDLARFRATTIFKQAESGYS